MGLVMQHIVENSGELISCYDTIKHIVDGDNQDLFGDFEDHKNNTYEFYNDKNIYAEDSPNKSNIHIINIGKIKKHYNSSCFKYFLDGSRHVYKTNDMVINGNVFPVVVGQIIVACCKRMERKISNYKFSRKLILVLPDQFDINDYGMNFIKRTVDDINKKLKACFKNNAIQFDDIICYNTDGSIEEGKNKYLHQAIAVVQNEMMDLERLMVEDLCSSNSLNKDEWLIKDGTLQYRKHFTNRPEEDIEFAKFKDKLGYVIGVSKMFDPELISKHEKRIGQIIADLPEYSRTNAYQYCLEDKIYCIWYLRLRKQSISSTRYSDIVKVEFIMYGNEKIETSLIDNISSQILNEAYPVCYGKDTRWGNHIYPVYLTERFCKSKYINENRIMKMV